MRVLRVLSILVLGVMGIFISSILLTRVVVPEMDWAVYLSEEFPLLAPPNEATKSVVCGIVILLCSWMLLQSLVERRPTEQYFALAGEDGDIVFRVRTKALEEFLNDAVAKLPHIGDASARIRLAEGSAYKVTLRAKAILDGLTLPQIRTSLGEQVHRDLVQMLGLPAPQEIVVNVEAIKPTLAAVTKDDSATYGTF
ncbi:MAG TPA: hypothetical protein PKH07_16010 [bacterium]|nr:hypothetical protein [bacterium]